MTVLANGVAPSAAVRVDDDGADSGAVAPLAAREERAFAEFVRLHVAGGAAAADTVAGYLREARLFRDRFLAPRGLALAALTEDHVVVYRRELVEAGYAATTIGTKLSALRRLLDAAVRAGALAANPAAKVGAPRDRRDPGGAAARALQLPEAQALIAAVAGTSALAVRDRGLVALFLGLGRAPSSSTASTSATSIWPPASCAYGGRCGIARSSCGPTSWPSCGSSSRSGWPTAERPSRLTRRSS